jgi:hypothetical protein
MGLVSPKNKLNYPCVHFIDTCSYNSKSISLRLYNDRNYIDYLAIIASSLWGPLNLLFDNAVLFPHTNSPIASCMVAPFYLDMQFPLPPCALLWWFRIHNGKDGGSICLATFMVFVVKFGPSSNNIKWLFKKWIACFREKLWYNIFK